MNRRQAGFLNVAISLCFAMAMVVVSKFSNVQNNDVWMGLLTAAWLVPFLTLSNWERPSVRCDNLYFICRRDH